MTIEPTPFKGLYILEPATFGDDRGYFMESYNSQSFRELGIEMQFVQDNQSMSKRGVVRGLHFQLAPYPQTKLVRVLNGAILDVAVDLRRDQPTFGKHFSCELTAQNKKQLLIPKGFAHGFVALSNDAEVFYKCDQYYHPAHQGGICYNDPALAIDWKVSEDQLILSERDKAHPPLSKAAYAF